MQDSRNKLTVLIADDNRDAADSMRMILDAYGHEAHVVYDGDHAVRMADQLRPGIILLDIGMPVLNGYDAARAIRRQAWSQSLILIAITGWGQNEDKQKALEAGFDWHLVKPIEAAAVIDLAYELLQRRRT